MHTVPPGTVSIVHPQNVLLVHAQYGRRITSVEYIVEYSTVYSIENNAVRISSV